MFAMTPRNLSYEESKNNACKGFSASPGGLEKKQSYKIKPSKKNFRVIAIQLNGQTTYGGIRSITALITSSTPVPNFADI